MLTFNKKVLILEDDLGLSNLISKKIKALGYLPLQAYTCEEACELITKEKPQAIILDYNLSSTMTGVDFYKDLRAKNIFIPAILSTGLENPKILIESIRAGIRDFVPKQDNYLDDLVIALENAMRQAKAEYEASIAQSLIQANMRIDAMNKRLQLSMSEAHHRIKNSLQNISSLLSIKTREGGALSEEEAQKLSAHIMGLSAMHDQLTEKCNEEDFDQNISIKPILENIVHTLQSSLHNRTIACDVEDISLPAKLASSLSVIVNELISNGIKHGDGDINVACHEENRTIELKVSNENSAFEPEFISNKKGSNGLKIVEALSMGDLGSKPQYANAHNSAIVSISFPLPQVA